MPGVKDGHSTVAHVDGRVLHTLVRDMRMSHNAVFQCAQGRVVALGGQAFDGSLEEQGIRRLVGRWDGEKIAWGSSQLVVSGDPYQTGCVEARCLLKDHHLARRCPRRTGRRTCEYDGKLSAVHWRGETLLFTRSNLYTSGGRHVQVARMSARGGRA